jgi:hypothetical protein
MGRLLALVVAMTTLGCGAADQPALANAPRPDPAAVAGAAAAAAAAFTLASPEAAARRPESNRDSEKKPITVKEHVTPDVLDRLDNGSGSSSKADGESQRQPGEDKEPPEPIDYSQVRGPPLTSRPAPPREHRVN